jgi:hypothetical protein
MKLNLKLLIGVALALVLCISPVGAVSGTDFEIVVGANEYRKTYKYHNVNDPDEKYTRILTYGTLWNYSLVTFKPANIPDAPEMVVDTKNGSKDIYLPQSVDVWDIKYYSHSSPMSSPSHKYLKNAGIVNLNELLEGYTSSELILELSWGQFISQNFDPWNRYNIPDVD